MRKFNVYHVPSSPRVFVGDGGGRPKPTPIPGVAQLPPDSSDPYLPGRALPADAVFLFSIEEEGPHTAWAAAKEQASEDRATPMGDTTHWQMYDA